jgi:AraC-like DNA-binding protein
MEPLFPFDAAEIAPDHPVNLACALWQVLYMTSGRFQYKQRTGVKVFPAPGVLFVPPGEGPRLRQDKDLSGHRLLLGEFLAAELEIRHRNLKLFSMDAPLVTYVRIPLAETDDIAAQFQVMLAEWTAKKLGYTDIILLKLAELCFRLIRLRDRRPAPGADITAGAFSIDEITAFLQEHFTENLSLEKIATAMGYSTSYLSRYFSAKTGICLFEYLNRLRVQKACLLLKKTARSVTEIAFASGYNNISFFNRMFRRIMRMSPLEYRLWSSPTDKLNLDRL